MKAKIAKAKGRVANITIESAEELRVLATALNHPTGRIPRTSPYGAINLAIAEEMFQELNTITDEVLNETE